MEGAKNQPSKEKRWIAPRSVAELSIVMVAGGEVVGSAGSTHGACTVAQAQNYVGGLQSHAHTHARIYLYTQTKTQTDKQTNKQTKQTNTQNGKLTVLITSR